MFKKISTILFIATSLFSCSKIGYGLYLWDFDDQNTGKTYKVVSESNIENSYTIILDDKKISIPKWKIELYKSEKEAKKAAKEYEKLNKMFGVCKKNNHKIRISKTPTAKIIYRLKKGEEIKIIGKDKEKSIIGSTNDYWYKVLTKNGISGYSYGHNLHIYEKGVGSSSINDADESKDLENILDKKFYPKNVFDTISEGFVNLSIINKNNYFLIDSKTKTIKLNSDDISGIYTYTKIESYGFNKYRFLETPIKITVRKKTEIVISNSQSKTGYGEIFYTIEDYDKLVQEEKEKNSLNYANIISNGKVFKSSVYGQITFDSGKNFLWVNNGKLVPDYIPTKDYQKGIISTNIFLSETIKEKYSGAIKFKFEQGHNLYALYLLSNRTLKLTLVPPYLVKDEKIVREPNAPIVISLRN